MFGGMMSEDPADEDDTVMQITIYLELIDMIDSCLSSYKARYVELQKNKLEAIQT